MHIPNVQIHRSVGSGENMDSGKFGTKTNTSDENLTKKEAAKNPMLEMDSDKIAEKTQDAITGTKMIGPFLPMFKKGAEKNPMLEMDSDNIAEKTQDSLI